MRQELGGTAEQGMKRDLQLHWAERKLAQRNVEVAETSEGVSKAVPYEQGFGALVTEDAKATNRY
jgi:hypothetical protein